MDMMKETIRYLEARLAECNTRPDLHCEQIRALENYLQMARTLPADEYKSRIEQEKMFALAQAEIIDRNQNLLRVHKTVGAASKMVVDRMMVEAAKTSHNHAELNDKITAVTESGTKATSAAQQAEGNITAIFNALLDLVLDAKPYRRDSNVEIIRSNWNRILQADPDCTWEKLCTYPPYRNRIPFDNARLERIGKWFKEVVG